MVSAEDPDRPDASPADEAQGPLDGTEMVDWDLAVPTARRLAKPGPDTSRDEAAAVVEELRRGAAASEQYVRDFTGLHAAPATAPVLVVDRGGWIQANADGFRHLLQPLIAKMRERRGQPSGVTA